MTISVKTLFRNPGARIAAREFLLPSLPSRRAPSRLAPRRVYPRDPVAYAAALEVLG